MIAFDYCENTPWLLGQQPLNTLSNVIFFALALWSWSHSSARYHRYGILMIGCGSLLWHTTATIGALWIDIAAIVCWAVLYAMDMQRLALWSPLKIWGTLLGSLTACVLLGFFGKPFLPMMSGAFLPFGGLLLGMSLRYPHERRVGCLSLMALVVAVFMRETDLLLCYINPYGTHFLWHLGTGVALIAPLVFLRRRYNTKDDVLRRHRLLF